MTLKPPLEFNDDRIIDATGRRIAFGLTRGDADVIIGAVHAHGALVDALRMCLDDLPMAAPERQMVTRALLLVDPSLVAKDKGGTRSEAEEALFEALGNAGADGLRAIDQALQIPLSILLTVLERRRVDVLNDAQRAALLRHFNLNP